MIAIPNESRQKIAEMRENEDEILGNLKVMPKELSDELSRIVLVKLLPAFIEKDLQSFGEALTAFNQKLGKFWRDYQGGTYCNEVVEEGVKIMLHKSSLACQTSWGPTFYSIVKGKHEADKLAEELRRFLNKKGGGEVFVTQANNHGATISEA